VRGDRLAPLSHAGDGYATEAATELLRFTFEELGLHRAVARIDASNAASIALAERLGMRREAHLVESWWHHESWVDEVHFAMLRSEWSASRAEVRPAGTIHAGPHGRPSHPDERGEQEH
jgi:RimJ/RimL family protein N-acetyltransferase